MGCVSAITVAFLSLLVFAAPVVAAIDYSSIGTVYTQTFNSLASSNMFNTWTNDSTLVGWHLFRRASNGSETPPVDVVDYDADDGTLNNGKFYSFGITSDAERALGGIGHPNFDGVNSLVPTGAVAGWIAASFTNNTGAVLDTLTMSFDGEQWVDGGNNGEVSPHQMVFEYGFGASFSAVATWTAPGGMFDWSAPIDTMVSGPVNGNTTGLVSARGGTITNLNWGDGQTLWLRWIERNDLGADSGMAIDNFSFTATAVPEPNAALFGGLVAGLSCLAALAKWTVGRLRTP